MNKDRMPVKNPDIVDRIEEKEALLFDPATGGMMCVNSTGIFIWGKCDGTHTCDDIIGEIEREYEVTRDESENDCEVFLTKLENKGFLAYKA